MPSAPLRFDGPRVIVATADPNNVFLLDEIGRKLNRELRTVVAPADDILRLLEQMSSDVADAQVNQIIWEVAADETKAAEQARTEVSDLEKIGNESPIIRFVNHLIAEAQRLNASDIHIEPKEKTLRIFAIAWTDCCSTRSVRRWRCWRRTSRG